MVTVGVVGVDDDPIFEDPGLLRRVKGELLGASFDF
jgi:hypothetical protein